MEQHTSQLINLTINGHGREVYVRNADTLLYTLRNQIGLMGAKPACKNGDCGACTVLIDGLPINACHILAVEAASHSITTIEGLTDATLQNAFMENWAIQCGYCTPGFILNSYALMQHNPNASDAEIDEWLDSNICRCTGYQEIKETVKRTLEWKKANG